MNLRLTFKFLLKAIYSKVETLAMGTSLGRRMLFTHRIRRMLAIPAVVSIEVTNACNADCIMCPRKRMKRPVKKMEFSLFRKIIDECASISVRKILPYFYGESLLLPDLERYLMYIHQKARRSKIILHTNGSLLTEEKAETVIRSFVHSLFITIDGASKATYERIRKNLVFEEVKNNVLNFIKMRNGLRRSRPYVNIGMIVMSENRHEVSAFLKFWRKVADHVYVGNFTTRAGSVKGKESGDRPNRRPCFRLWNELDICNNGDVALCCNDWDCTMKMGNFGKESLRAIWAGGKFQRIRQIHMKDDSYKIPLCRKCNPDQWDAVPIWWDKIWDFRTRKP